MNFEKPIVFFDLETTGVNTNEDRIVQIALMKVEWPINNLEPNGIVYYVNPGIPIPKEASEVHGITDEMVAKSPAFRDIINDILDYLDGCDIAGFNCLHFDVPLLYNEFARVGINWDWRKHKIIDVRNIFVQKEPRDLAAAVKFYCGKDIEGAHDAMGDVASTYDVFLQHHLKYDDLPETAEELETFCNYGNAILDLGGKFKYDENGVVVFAFGKHINKPAASERGYLEWMLSKDFPEDTKQIIKQILG